MMEDNLENNLENLTIEELEQLIRETKKEILYLEKDIIIKSEYLNELEENHEES